MKVEVYRDFACSWSRLSVRRFDRAVEMVGGGDIELVHRPYQLNPDLDPDAAPRPLLDVMAGIFGSREQAESMLGNMARLGAGEGAEYQFDRALAVSTFTAHRLMWLALRDYPNRIQNALADAIYDAYFRDGRNIADPAELTAVAESVGMDGGTVRAFLASDEGADEVRAQVAAARADGVTSVPTFVFPNGEVLRGASETEAIAEALSRARG